MTVKLEYRRMVRGRPPAAMVTANAKLTKTQIIVYEQVGDVQQLTSSGICLGGLPIRFKRKNGSPIPQQSMGGWRLADGELARINAEEKDFHNSFAYLRGLVGKDD
jgi:hypothetical protein